MRAEGFPREEGEVSAQLGKVQRSPLSAIGSGLCGKDISRGKRTGNEEKSWEEEDCSLLVIRKPLKFTGVAN